MARRPVTDLSAWPSISLEGNLIAPAMLARIDERTAPEQSPEDYGVRKGLTLREDISTAFRVGQSHFDASSKLSNPSADATRRFVKAFLKETFGFDDVEDGEGLIALFAGDKRIPVIVVPPDEERLDRRSATLSVERSRSPAFALQDYLNEEDNALWGLATNGTVIRLMRDNASLTRPAFIEADLAQIFSNEDAASFGLLWLLIHRSRFGNAGAPATDCALERWRETGTKEGEVARDRLAAQVKLALNILGSGFLEANPALAAKLQSGEQNLTEWFNELLRLVYRLIFLMVAEDRNLLHPKVSRAEARKLYADGYSLAYLRAQCFRGATWDRHHDRYEGIKIVFRSLAGGQEALALPALGGLFAPNMLPSLETAKLRNRAFMEALYRLSWLQGKTGMAPVNWRAMETEELGSVYESLLELQPQLGDDGKSLVFASDAAEQKGNQRKTTGSYYTPDSLVQALLDTALDPVLDKTEAEADDPETALLNLSVIDPACGSGHFLLAAARRIATRVARIRADGTPAQEDFRHALRDVARSCIHGVDRNPMAVELTKVALWIETVDPGLPLGFFDAQIRCGDALLGVFDLAVLEEGIPDAAYKPLTGDEKDVAKYYREKNKREVKERETIASGFGFNRQQDFMREFARLRAMPENTVRQIEAKAEKLRTLTQEGATAWTLETACDLYVSAFLLPKTKDDPHAGPDGLPRRGAETVPTSGAVWEWLRGVQLFGPLFANGIDAARKARAFHWPLEFPDVMQRGGFDVVLGNPPWDIVQQEDDVSSELNDRLKAVFKQGPYEVLSGRRDLYKLFLCRLPDLLRTDGVSAMIVPVGFLIEEDCLGLRQRLWDHGCIDKVVHFQNARKGFFSQVHASYRFSITEYRKSNYRKHWFSYTISNPVFSITDEIGLQLEGDDFNEYLADGAFGELHKDLDGLKSHRSILGLDTFSNGSKFGLLAEWHATTHKAYAVSATTQDALPVGKNRDIHQFNDQYCEASFFVSKESAEERAREKGICLVEHGSRILIRDIARNDDTVTLISCLTDRKLSSYDTPAVQVAGNGDGPITREQALLLVGFLNSRIADFIIRPYVDKHIKGYVLRRVPVPDLDAGTSGAQQTLDIVRGLIKLGKVAGEKPIWETPNGLSLLRKLDTAVADWLGISASDLKVVFREFPHIYSAEMVDTTSLDDNAVGIALPPLITLPDGAWARPAPNPQLDPVTALAALLKSISGPTPSRTLRLAVIMMLEPHLFTPLLTDTDRRNWQRLVGQEAAPQSGNVTALAAHSAPGWNTAITNHRGNGRLIEDLAARTWAPGQGLDAFNTTGWADGRAQFALRAIAELGFDTVMATASDPVREFVNAA